jgi:amino acid transporter
MFFNRLIPKLQNLGLFLVLGGGIITIIVVAAMPKTHASNSFVWKDWNNQTGWKSGVAFLTGVLNGAFTIGTPDAITHLAEELPNPKRDMPIAVMAQIGLGGICESRKKYCIKDHTNMGNSCIPVCHCDSLRH